MRYTISRTLDIETHKPLIDGIASRIFSLRSAWPSTAQIEHELQCDAQILIAELVKWLPEIGWFLTGHDANLPLINKCLDACSEALRAVEHAVSGPETRFNEMCNCRITVRLFGQTETTVYDNVAHLDDHMVWFWGELVVRAVVPRRYYVRDLQQTRKDIISNIRKHDRSSLIYDSIHDIRTDGWHGWGDQTWSAHWSKEVQEYSKISVDLCNRAGGDRLETLVFIENP